MKIKKYLLHFIFLILALVTIIKPYINKAFPYTHDGMNHLVRFANYKIALREGQLPPRFAPNLFNKYGYPVFNYNYPLANLISLPFSIIGIHYELTFKIQVLFALIIAIVGINWWLKQLKFSLKIRLFSIISFLVSNFLVNLFYFRGNIGEIWAISLLPILFATIEYYKNKLSTKNLLLTIPIWIAFLLSHNISVLFGCAFLFLYAIFAFKNKASAWKNLLIVFMWSLVASFWFWLPALLEKNQIILDNISLSTDFAQHFPTLKQLLFATYNYGFSYLGRIDSISFALGHLKLLIVFLSLFLFTKTKKFKKYYFLWFLAFITIIGQLNFTKNLWQIIPLVAYIQFPWRLSLFFSVLVLPLTALVYQQLKKFRLLFYLLIFIQIISINRLKAADYFHKNEIDYDAYVESTSTLNENRVKTFNYTGFADWQPQAKIASGSGNINTHFWQGSKRAYQLDLNTEAIIIEPTMYFLGWQTTANNKLIEYIDNEEIAGRLAYQLPAGQYEIVSKFTQKTTARIVGNLFSAGAILAWLIAIFINWKKNETK